MTHSLIERDDSDASTPATEAFFAPILFHTLFWRPRYLVDDPVVSYLPFLFWLTAAIKPERATTLGCGTGTAHFGFCQAVEKLGLDAQVTGIGFWTNDESPSIPAELAGHQDMLYESVSCLQSYASPEEGFRSIPKGECDLLFVDLAALPNTASISLDDISDCLSPTGTAILHGTNDLGDRALDQRKLDRIIAATGHIRMTVDLGMIVLMGKHMPVGPVQALVDHAKVGRLSHEIDLVFRRSGQGLRRAVEAEARGHLLDDSHRTLADTRVELAKAEKKIEETRQSAETRARELAELQAEIFHLRKAHQTLLERQSDYDRAIGQLEELRTKLAQTETDRDDERNTYIKETAILSRIAEDLRQKLLVSEEDSERERSTRFKETAALERLAERLRNEHDALRKENVKLEHQIENFWQSASWRVTAPLRFVKSALTHSRKH